MLKNVCYAIFLLMVCLISETALAFDWQGSYVGGYIGRVVGYDRAVTDIGASDNAFFQSQADITAVEKNGTSNNHSDAAIAGIQAGQNWVNRKTVFGVTMDLSALSLQTEHAKNNIAYPDSSDQYSISTSLRTRWFFSLCARMGYPLVLHRRPSLFYVTAGPVLANIKIHNTFSDNSAFSGVSDVQNSVYALGWLAGLGVDTVVSRDLFLELQYSFVQIHVPNATGTISNSAGTFGSPAGSLTNPFTVSNRLHASVLTLGLNDRFDE